jgi:uncharacterized protein
MAASGLRRPRTVGCFYYARLYHVRPYDARPAPSSASHHGIDGCDVRALQPVVVVCSDHTGSDLAQRAEFVMDHDHYSDTYLRDVLAGVRTIAVVGASPRPHRPSHGVMRYLQRQGYRAIPVNPFAAGTMILGETCYASLADIPRAEVGPIDMVDIFRRSEMAGAVVDEAIALGGEPGVEPGIRPAVKTVWMQLGVVDTAAAARAEANGISVVMDRCPAIEIPRLGLARPAPS